MIQIIVCMILVCILICLFWHEYFVTKPYNNNRKNIVKDNIRKAVYEGGLPVLIDDLLLARIYSDNYYNINGITHELLSEIEFNHLRKMLFEKYNYKYVKGSVPQNLTDKQLADIETRYVTLLFHTQDLNIPKECYYGWYEQLKNEKEK